MKPFTLRSGLLKAVLFLLWREATSDCVFQFVPVLGGDNRTVIRYQTYFANTPTTECGEPLPPKIVGPSSRASASSVEAGVRC